MQAGCRSCLRKNTNWNGRPVRWTYWHDTVRKAIKSWAVYSQGTRDGCRTQHLNRSSSPRNGGTLHRQQRRNSSRPLQLGSMCTVFWARKGVLLVDFLPKGSKINPGAHSDTQKKNCAARSTISDVAPLAGVLWWFMKTLAQTLPPRRKITSRHLAGNNSIIPSTVQT